MWNVEIRKQWENSDLWNILRNKFAIVTRLDNHKSSLKQTYKFYVVNRKKYQHTVWWWTNNFITKSLTFVYRKYIVNSFIGLILLDKKYAFGEDKIFIYLLVQQDRHNK